MQDLVKMTIKKYEMLCQGETIVLAISGGIDSMVLLHIFNNLKDSFGLRLVIAHVDHAKRAESKLDRQLIQRVAKTLSIPFELATLPPQTTGENFHHYAHNFRYDFFETVAKKYQATTIATAHHANDHLETVIGSMLKSGNSSAIQGILPKSQLNNLNVIRPLINLQKSDIINYADKYQISYLEDASNNSQIYTRNRIRKNIIPTLLNESPTIIENARKLSDDLKEDEGYFDYVVQNIMNEWKIPINSFDLKAETFDIKLSVENLVNLHFSIRKRLFKKMFPSLSARSLDLLNEKLQKDEPSWKLDIGEGILASKSYDVFGLERHSLSYNEEDFDFILELDKEIRLPDGRKMKLMRTNIKKNEFNGTQNTYLCYNMLCMPIRVRGRIDGDKIALKNDLGHYRVKKLMIDKKIPIYQRASWPIVEDACGKIIWIPGLKTSSVCLNEPNSSEDLWLEIYE